MLNRLARLNEGVSVVQEVLRGRSPMRIDEAWFDWHGEAVSLREDLYIAARGWLPDGWITFRDAVRPADRERLAARHAQMKKTGDIRIQLAQPLRSLGH